MFFSSLSLGLKGSEPLVSKSSESLSRCMLSLIGGDGYMGLCSPLSEEDEGELDRSDELPRCAEDGRPAAVELLLLFPCIILLNREEERS